MTPAQLEILAGVMGYEYFEMNYFGESSCTARQHELEKWFDKMGMDSIGTYLFKVENNEWMEFKDFYPDTDLNQALLLLDAFNAKHRTNQTTVETTYDGWRIFIKAGSVKWKVKTKDLASELCKAILERLDSKPKV